MHRHLSDADAAATLRLLHEAPYGYLAMNDSEGPYVVPLNFAYSEGVAARGPESGSGEISGTILFHTGEGRKTAALATDPRVCLAVTSGTAFIQGDDPCRDGFAYHSLLVWGRARRIEDAHARETALRTIVAKYDPSAVDMPFGEKDFARTLLYEIAIEAVSYKQEPWRA